MKELRFSELTGILLLIPFLLIGSSQAEKPTAPKNASLPAVRALAEPSMCAAWLRNPNNSHYYRLTASMNWMDAEAQAVQWGGHLATINDAGEEAWLVSQFGSTEGALWIGFNDIAEEGNWVWVSDEPVTYTNWAPGEPNNSSGVEPPPIGSPENAAAVFWYPDLGEYRWNDLPESVTYPVGVVERSGQVSIDIKPGTLPNSINPNRNGVIPVAILSSATFDATTVDPLSVKFGPNGATAVHGKSHIQDADGDGDQDLVLNFKAQETGLQCGYTSASLTGCTYSEQPIEGSDSINTVGCK